MRGAEYSPRSSPEPLSSPHYSLLSTLSTAPMFVGSTIVSAVHLSCRKLSCKRERTLTCIRHVFGRSYRSSRFSNRFSGLRQGLRLGAGSEGGFSWKRPMLELCDLLYKLEPVLQVSLVSHLSLPECVAGCPQKLTVPVPARMCGWVVAVGVPCGQRCKPGAAWFSSTTSPE